MQLSVLQIHFRGTDRVFRWLDCRVSTAPPRCAAAGAAPGGSAALPGSVRLRDLQLSVWHRGDYLDVRVAALHAALLLTLTLDLAQIFSKPPAKQW